MKNRMLLIILVFFYAYFQILFSQDSINSSYYPLEIGNQWNYSNQFFSKTEKIVDTTRINGLLYYGLASWDDHVEYWFREDSNRVYLLNTSDSNDFVLFNFNADTGKNWQLPPGYECSFGTKITLVSKEDSIITPAGTFLNCYHFKHHPYCCDAGIYDTWFAKGTGKVRYLEDNYAGMLENNLNSYSVITSINLPEQSFKIDSYRLYQDFPNPFNGSTAFSYALAYGDFIKISVFTVSGELTDVLYSGYKTAGNHKIRWRPEGNISTGLYFYQLQTSELVLHKKSLYIK
jgi:hypothetical protein